MSHYEFEQVDAFFEPQTRTYTWYQIWSAALTRPSTATFVAILDDHRASANRGLIWMAIVGAIATALTLFFGDFGVSAQDAILAGIFFGSFGSFFSLLIGGYLMQSAAKLIGGRGTYHEYWYASAAFSAPITLINGLIVPFATTQSLTLTLITMSLLAYQLVLTGMALRAVNDFTWEQAIGAMVLNVILWVGIIIGLVVAVSMLI